MSRKAVYQILGAAGLSLLISSGYPFLSDHVSQPIAQAQTRQAEMTLTQLERILTEEASDVEGTGGQWRLTLGDRDLIVLADASNNRMRIMAPIGSASELSAQQIQSMLLANFHTALDARYALSGDTVVAIFVHPLSSLDEGYLRSALSQVATAANTFGTTYSSGGLGFGPDAQSEQNALPSDRNLSI